MPNESTDKNRPAEAAGETRPVQQRHVDETIDDSFPASDPPAWTTSGSKSVAAESGQRAADDQSIMSARKLRDVAQEASRSVAQQASGIARDLYQRGESYLDQGRLYLPEARDNYRRGSEVVSRSIEQRPLATALAFGVVGCAIGWLIGRRMSGTGSEHKWRPEYNRRPQEPRHWRPAPRASYGADRFPFRNRAEAASHTNNSF